MGRASPGATLKRYGHADAASAERLLAQDPEATSVIATDGVFSMDGDLAPLPALARWPRRPREPGWWSMMRTASACWARAAAACSSTSAWIAMRCRCSIGTLGKAFGSFGAFVAGDAALIELLVQKARPYIYTTALPQAVAAATRAALRLAQGEGWRRERVHALTARFRAGALAAGVPLAASTTPIQPVMLGSAAAALSAQRQLQAAGLLGGRDPPAHRARAAARGCALRCRPRTAKRSRRARSTRWARRAPSRGGVGRVSALYYEVHGEGCGRDLVLLHGWSMNLRVWDGLVRALARAVSRHRRRPAGTRRAAAGTRRPRTPAAQAWRVHETLAPLTERYALLGWSLGGQLALDLAAALPAAIERLALIATTPKLPRFTRAGAAARRAPLLARLVHRLHAEGERAVQDFLLLQTRGCRPGTAARVLAKLRAALRAHGEACPEALAAGLARLREGDLRAALPLVRVPALVMAGQRDRIIRAVASRKLARRCRRRATSRSQARRTRRSCRTRVQFLHHLQRLPRMSGAGCRLPARPRARARLVRARQRRLRWPPRGCRCRWRTSCSSASATFASRRAWCSTSVPAPGA